MGKHKTFSDTAGQTLMPAGSNYNTAIFGDIMPWCHSLSTFLMFQWQLFVYLLKELLLHHMNSILQAQSICSLSPLQRLVECDY